VSASYPHRYLVRHGQRSFFPQGYMSAHQALAELQEHVEVAVGEGGHVVGVARGGEPRPDAQGRPGETQRRRHRQLRTCSTLSMVNDHAG